MTVSESNDDGASRRRGKRQGDKKEKKQRPFWQELPILIGIAAIIAALMVTFVGRPYVIPSQSMENTLKIGDRIYVQKLSYYWGDPQPGDVVVFVGPSSSWNASHRSIRSDNTVVRGVQNFFSFFGLVPPDENDLVKRVIAVGGQTVQCCDAQGRVMVDGKPLDEPYARYDVPYVPGRQAGPDARKGQSSAGREFGPVKVAEGRVWVMGDNRNQSADSRYHMDDEYGGQVPVSDIRGKAVFRIWPINRIGPIHAVDPQTN
ncbi:signal peptidase I [Nocardia sp. NPDC052566]|uniref:signal peptidase I n=1 Tax=Nocardia sp. NPDC052566 TaxID=3364330 RepID=UPI0037CBA0BF